MTTVRLEVEGMSCDHCKRAVEGALRARDGVLSASVLLAEGSARVEFDPERISAERLVEAVEDEGYAARVA